MAYYIIKPGDCPAAAEDGGIMLSVCEAFADAVQGEGVCTGCPAVFLRLAGCHLKCAWCDTVDIRDRQCRISVSGLVDIFRKNGVIGRLERGHHLVLTGGAPMLQQDALTVFLRMLHEACANKPFVEVENECTVAVSDRNAELWSFVDCWNNSPKLSNSGVGRHRRYNPEAICQMSSKAEEAWFKFVVNGEDDWDEIEKDFISPGYIARSRVILMPEGQTRAQLCPEKKRDVLEMAARHDVRYGGRLQIDVYDNLKGV